LERTPHKSGWKVKKKKVEISETIEEKSVLYVEIMEKLQKMKTYILVCVALLVLPTLIFLFIWGGILFYIPFISLVVVVILIFFIYFPISDLQKKPPEK
jgi:hypothetical protein